MLLKDKVIVVIGGCGLIGKEVVKLAAKNGANVINADINSDELHFDITEAESIKSGFKSLYEKYGKIDGVVNCAYPRTKDWGAKLEDIQLESWRKNVDMQLNSLLLITQESIRYMKKGASFVNFASIYGVVGNDFTIYEETTMCPPAAYSAIKSGVINFTRFLASYLGERGIRANCVSPGGVFDNQNEKFVEHYSHKCPLKRMAKASEIAPAVIFLLSDGASYVTGHNLLIDGGWCAI